MRNARPLLACLLAPLWGASPGAAAALPQDFEDPAARARQTRLPNGLTVLTLEDHSTPVVSFQLWVKVGSRDETRYSGLAHLFEHMMFKGSKRVGPGQHARLVESRGGELNAYTSRDATVYFEDVTPDSLPLVIDLEAERVAHLEISERTLASEREVVIEERRMRNEDDPEGQTFEALMSLAFRAHPYRRPVIGWRSDLEALDVAACRSFFGTYYVPNNMVIAIVGPIDGAQTLARVERAFGGLEPAAEVPRNPTREQDQRGERFETIHFDARGPLLAVAWHAPPAGHEDGPALDVLGLVLAGGRSSRLYQRLVRGEEVALYAQGGYWEMLDAGLFSAQVGVRPGADIERARAVLFEEIERLQGETVGAAELAKAKRQLEVSLVQELRTSHALAARLARDSVTFGRIRPLPELLAKIQAVGPEDVRRVARRYLVEEKRSRVELVPAAADPLELAERGGGS